MTWEVYWIRKKYVILPPTTLRVSLSYLIYFFFNCRCGQETRVIPRILQLRSHWLKSDKESLRLQEAGITKEVMNSAIAQFCLEIIAKHGEPAPRLCNKDPLTLKMGTYVIELFPNVSSISIGLHKNLISKKSTSEAWMRWDGVKFDR